VSALTLLNPEANLVAAAADEEGGGSLGPSSAATVAMSKWTDRHWLQKFARCNCAGTPGTSAASKPTVSSETHSGSLKGTPRKITRVKALQRSSKTQRERGKVRGWSVQKGCRIPGLSTLSRP